MNDLAYEDLDFPVYVNSAPVMKLKAEDSKERDIILDVTLSDTIKIAELCGGSVLNIGDTRNGKSQAMMDINRYHFGGEASDEGKSNWIVARNDFTANGQYETIDQSQIGEGRGKISDARVLRKENLEAMCTSLDEVNLALPEVQVEFFGMAEGRHNSEKLGKDGYHFFQASCNINRVNGDFAGTSVINRALLNRFMITLDHDRYRSTDKDRDLIDERKASGKLMLAPIRDISDKILKAHEGIEEKASQRNPFIDAYTRVLSSGLDYCNKDEDKLKKRIWPTRCGSCDFAENDLCSLVKHSNTGTIGALKKFVFGTEYLMKLKYGDDISIDPASLVFEAFKLTTYHGNLNEVEINSVYYGEDQELMEAAVKKLKNRLKSIKGSVDTAISSALENGSAETRFLEVHYSTMDSTQGDYLPYTKENRNSLDEAVKSRKDLSYEVVSPFDSFAEQTGIRMDWFKGYLESIIKTNTK